MHLTPSKHTLLLFVTQLKEICVTGSYFQIYLLFFFLSLFIFRVWLWCSSKWNACEWRHPTTLGERRCKTFHTYQQTSMKRLLYHWYHMLEIFRIFFGFPLEVGGLDKFQRSMLRSCWIFKRRSLQFLVCNDVIKNLNWQLFWQNFYTMLINAFWMLSFKSIHQ